MPFARSSIGPNTARPRRAWTMSNSGGRATRESILISASPEAPLRASHLLRAFAAAFVCGTVAVAQPAPSSSTAPTPEAASALRTYRDKLGSPTQEERKAACDEFSKVSLQDLNAEAEGLRATKKDRVATSLQRVAKHSREDNALTAILGFPPSPESEPVLAYACILHAYKTMGTLASAKALLGSLAAFDSAFVPFGSDLLRELGDRAVPALVDGRRSRDTRRLSKTLLEDMKRWLPGDAIQTKDPEVLAEILRAFGQLHDTEALAVILAFINAEKLVVRQAAREATLMFGQDGIWRLRESYTNLVGQAPPEHWKAEEMATSLFSALDNSRLRDVFQLLDEGLKKAHANDLAGAIADFDRVLAREPLIERRVELTESYVAFADTLMESDPVRARSYLRRAIMVSSPTDPLRNRAHARELYLEGLESVRRGEAESYLFRRALELDPNLDKAKAELSKLEEMHETESSKRKRTLLGAACGVLALVLIGLWTRARRNA